MENEKYKPNSNKYKEQSKEHSLETKHVQKVVSGPVKVKKKGELRKLTEIFLAEDVNKVKDYAIQDVIIPGIKKAIWEIFTNGLDMFLYGGSGQGRRSSGPASKVSYSSYYNRNDNRSSNPKPSVRNTYSYDSVIIPTRGEAEDVLVQMKEIVDQYGTVSVADFYDLVGVTGTYTDNKYGWTSNIHSAYVDRVRGDGYVIRLPRAAAID